MDEPANPLIEGLEPTFRHLDDPDVPWQQCRRQRNADGTESSVWEKWLAFSPDPQYLSLYARYDPGMIVRRHGHYSPHVVFVIEGELWVGDRRCPAGTHIELPARRRVRPAAGRRRGRRAVRGDDGRPALVGRPARAASTQALAEQGAEPLPDVELDYPDWLADLRHHWVGADDRRRRRPTPRSIRTRHDPPTVRRSDP